MLSLSTGAARASTRRTPSWRRVRGTPKSHGAGRLGSFHAREHRDAHHHRVVLLLLERQRTAATEAREIRIALLPTVVGGHQATGILDPFPDHAVQIAD